ncbi:MAG: hypothetical protein M3256_02065 [Actinomycetota bacterium]|nr:hypothetical protein [Actinomycetota bacterium]
MNFKQKLITITLPAIVALGAGVAAAHAAAIPKASDSRIESPANTDIASSAKVEAPKVAAPEVVTPKDTEAQGAAEDVNEKNDQNGEKDEKDANEANDPPGAQSGHDDGQGNADHQHEGEE